MAADLQEMNEEIRRGKPVKGQDDSLKVRKPGKAVQEPVVRLEFPYSDLELLYDYLLKEMGIRNPFK